MLHNSENKWWFVKRAVRQFSRPCDIAGIIRAKNRFGTDAPGGCASIDLFLANCRSCFPVERPRIDESLTLLGDFGQTDAICTEVFDDPAREQGLLLKVMARGPFEQGQQVWIVDEEGSKVGARVENVFEQTIDSEVTLSTVLPA